jgi:hypothetical protein
MLLSFKCVWPLLSIGAAAAWAASLPASAALRFEAVDAQNTRWTIRGADYGSEFAADRIRLARQTGDTLTVRLIGASRFAPLRGELPLSSRSFYFRGSDPQQWRSNVQHFARLRAERLYPGIDAVYYQGENGLETDFILSAGTDPSRIQLQFDRRRVALDSQGNLRDKNDGGLLMTVPAAYEIDEQGNRQAVYSRFRLLSTDRASFRVDRRNLSRVLVIDPILSFATFLGGSGRDTAVAIERGLDGRIYVVGNTTSVDLPQAVALNSLVSKPVVLPVEDTFVACYSADGSSLAYIVYVGGDGQDLATSLAVDSQGRVTVVGSSASKNFPTTPGALGPTFPTGYQDAFAYRLTSDGSALEYSTFLHVVFGYLTTPPIFLVGVDASGAATVGGTALSFLANGVTPLTITGVTPTKGAFQTKSAGGNDIFVLRLTPDGTAMQWATLYGGAHDEALQSMAVDAAGEVFVVGSTNSNDLPLVNPFQAAPPTVYSPSVFYNSATAGFFAKFAPNGSAVTAASYFGGQSNNSNLNSVALDDTGAIYLGGISPLAAAPGVTDVSGPGPANPNAYPSGGVLVKLDPTGTSKQFAWAYSFLSVGSVLKVRVDRSHRPCLLTSFDFSKASPGAFVSDSYPGLGFVCFQNDGKTLNFATTAPGDSLNLMSVDFTLDPSGAIIGAGTANPGSGATQGPVTLNALQQYAGASDAYVFKIQPENPLPKLYYVSPTLLYTPTANTTFGPNFSFLGANFAEGLSMLWNGVPFSVATLPQPYMTTNLMTVGISPATLATLPKGDVQIQVSLPGPGGGVSNPISIKYLNPPPGNLFITPSVVPTGSGSTTFTLSGTLTPDCTVTWNGAPETLRPTPVGQSGFQFTMPGSAFATAADIVVAASNPAPGGGSSVIHVSVTASGLPVSIPTITAPVVVGVGQGGVTQTLTVSGTLADAAVVWNGSDRPTTRVNSTTLQFVLSLNDVNQMGSAQVQVRSGGVLGPPVTAYIGMAAPNSYIHGDATRQQAYFASNNAAGQLQILAAAAIPAGTILRTLDLGAKIMSFFLTDDNAYFWVTTVDGKITRVNVDSFAVDMTATVPVSSSVSTTITAIPVAGGSSTIVAAGGDGTVRIFDGGSQRGFSSVDLLPAPPQYLVPVFATPDTVWTTAGYNCMVRLSYDYTGFSSFTEICNNSVNGPWGLQSDEVKLDAGVTYFQSGSEIVVWNSPRSGYVDFSHRRIVATSTRQASSNVYYLNLSVYDLDSELQTGFVPQSGSLPNATLVPYSGSQVLLGASSMVILVDLP